MQDNFTDLEKKIYTDLLSITKEDKSLAENFNLEEESPLDSLDSQERIVIMVEFLAERDPSLIEKRTIEYLFKVLEKENEYFLRILRIFKDLKNDHVKELVKNYLEKNQNVNRILLNISVLNENYKIINNKELSDFLEMVPNFTTFNFLKSYIHLMEVPCLQILLERLLKRERNVYFYKIFTEMNLKAQEKNMNLMDDELKQDEDYVNFIYSLMVDEESIVYGYEKLYQFDYFNSLYSAIKSLIKLNRFEEKFMLPEDECFMEILLKVILKLTNQNVLRNNNKINTTVILLAENFFDLLCVKLSLGIKSVIYKILKNLGIEDEISRKVAELLISDYVTKVAYIDFEQEKLENEFECTSSFLWLTADYKYKKINEFCFHVLTSESPKIVRPVLKIFEVENYKIENGLIFKHLKEACVKDPKLIDDILDYCLSLKFVLPSVDLTNIIMSKESQNFFSYVSLFPDFSFYLSNDFLKRLSEDRISGLECLLKMKNISDFIIKNKNYFNLLVKIEKDTCVLKLMIKIYNKIITLSSVHQFSFTDDKKILLPKIFCSDLFKLFSKCLIYYNLNNKKERKEYLLEDIIVPQEDLKDYCDYLKVQLVLGYDIKIQEIIRVHSGKYIDDLVGYYRSFGNRVKFDSLSLQTRIFERKKDNTLFLKHYEESSKFIKFIFFNVVDINELILNVNQKKEFEKILRNQIISLKIEGLNSEENLLLFKCILNFLLLLDNIESIIKIINEINELPDCLTDLLIKVSIQNLSNGGTKFIKKTIKKGSVDLQLKFLLLVYLRNIWNNEMHYWLIELQSKVNNNSDMDYLVRMLGNK